MKQFEELLNILDRLIGPEGCPWDQEQTFESLRSTVLEEACEVIDAIDEKNSQKILEEVGDLLLNVVFFCKLGEKEKSFTTQQVIETLNEKLIRRHPHVFGDVKLESTDQVWEQWDTIKENEKAHSDRKSAIDGIPRHLPSLARASKMIKKMKRAHFFDLPPPAEQSFTTEEDVGSALLSLVQKAREADIDAEQALRKTLTQIEQEFRTWESQ